jgi:hypothetical protein
VIPVYKAEPSESELFSLRRCKTMLGHYPTFLVTPEGLDISVYKNEHSDIQQVTFDKKYFDGVKGYNQLCMSPQFYQPFLNYEYLFLYQLDALVFRDELMEWCKKGYSYIGAPWIEVPPSGKKTIYNLSKHLYQKVGNGGLSLRKTKQHYRNALIFKPLMSIFPKNEDFFWCLFISFINPWYTKPKMLEALQFAFELAPRKAFELNQQQLPFGVHAWEKYDLEFWKPYL